MAIKVNMFSRSETSEAQPRSKKGHPAHSTTGVASTNWTQLDARWSSSAIRPAMWPAISSTKTGAASASPIQNRRVMSISSGLGPVCALGDTGSSAMPQMGQPPGPTCRTWGCIGQVKTALAGMEPPASVGPAR